MPANANKQIITAAGSAPIFSAAIRSGDKVYLAGLIGTGADGALVAGGVQAETVQALKNATERLAHAGLDLSDVISVTIYVNDYANNIGPLNEVYPAQFPKDVGLPVRTAIGVAALPLNAAAEFQIIAAARS
ncbi:RutC family protein [Vanrija pseudolonga]|uniref:RutC family protein n=1 Tax=Vanrija pseudolonga TaxID=143232 RepID=A0AAF1BEH9_9TREE|nr:RutC family protein [Vanrija pseudolonga]